MPEPRSINSSALRFLSRYGLVGIAGAITHFLILYVAVEKFHLSEILSTSIAFLWVVLQNYLLHYHWAFKSERRHEVTFPLYLVLTFSGFWINLLVFWGALEFSGNYLLSQVVASLIVIVWNFIGSRFFIFK